MRKCLAAIFTLMILLFAASPAMSADTSAAHERTAIEILHENGIINGGEDGLAPERYMTCTEFIAAASRIFNDDYVSTERSFGDWKEAAMWFAIELCANDETYERVKERFDEPITPELAQEIMIGMLSPSYKIGDEFGYHYWLSKEKSGTIRFNGLADIGYDTRIIPNAQYITREEACGMLCEMLYLEYPVIGDYRPSFKIGQYTLYGQEIVCELGTDADIGKDLFGRRPKGVSSWKLPDDIRSRLFLEENITVGMSREEAENLIGKPWKKDGECELYYYYDPLNENDGYGFMSVEYGDGNIQKLTWIPREFEI